MVSCARTGCWLAGRPACYGAREYNRKAAATAAPRDRGTGARMARRLGHCNGRFAGEGRTLSKIAGQIKAEVELRAKLASRLGIELAASVETLLLLLLRPLQPPRPGGGARKVTEPADTRRSRAEV